MFKKFSFLFLVAVLLCNLFVPTQSAHAGASIGGEVSLQGANSLSVFVQSTVHLQVWGYSGLLYEKNIDEVSFIDNIDKVQFFKLTPLHGEVIGLSNNTQGVWNDRGDSTWHRANVKFTLYKSGDAKLWAMFTWSPFWDMRGSATAVNLKITFPKGIKVNFLPECQNGCIKNYHFERGGGFGIGSSWNVVPLNQGKHVIRLEWQEEGGIFPERGSSTIVIQKGKIYSPR